VAPEQGEITCGPELKEQRRLRSCDLQRPLELNLRAGCVTRVQARQHAAQPAMQIGVQPCLPAPGGNSQRMLHMGEGGTRVPPKQVSVRELGLELGSMQDVAGPPERLVSDAALRFVGAPAALPLCSASSCPNPPPAYKLLRYEEDYSYLKDPSCRTDFWDPIKYIPLWRHDDWYVSFGGEVRERLGQQRRPQHPHALVTAGETHATGTGTAPVIAEIAMLAIGALTVVRGELTEWRWTSGRADHDAVSPEELERSREHVKGRLVLSLDRIGSTRLLRLTSQTQAANHQTSVSAAGIDGVGTPPAAPRALIGMSPVGTSSAM